MIAGEAAHPPGMGREEEDNVRSLLSCEALVDDLGVAVDAQVLDGGGVGRGAGAVCPPGELSKRSSPRPKMSRSSLHVDVLQQLASWLLGSEKETKEKKQKESGDDGQLRCRDLEMASSVGLSSSMSSSFFQESFASVIRLSGQENSPTKHYLPGQLGVQ